MAEESHSPPTESQSTKIEIGDIDGDFTGTIAGRDVSIVQKFTNIFTGTPDQQRTLRNRQALLTLVKDFWVKGVLENSLHGAVLIELGMEERKEAVEHPWDMVLQTPDQPNRTLEPGTKIVDVFDEMGQNLLVLGEPGSGKTTMLLELARDLIARAEQDPAYPIPVVFNLSSWAEARSSLAEWLVEELNTKYNIPKKIARPWVENDELLLLLDGLDEVAADHRDACVQAINDFRQEHLLPVVVCSRIADYEELASRLKLEGAVLLQSLTAEQINAYLDGAGPELAAVRMTLQEDASLQELAQSPLTLSIMTLAYRGLSTKDLPPLDTTEARRKHLFDTYIDRMFQRRGKDAPYTPKQVIERLSWLAQNMHQHNLSLFLIENLQPSWLPTPRLRRLYVFGSRLTGGLMIGLILLPFILFPRFEHSSFTRLAILWFLLAGGMMGGLLIGIFDGRRLERYHSHGRLDWLYKLGIESLVRNSLSIAVVVWITFFSIYAVYVILGRQYELFRFGGLSDLPVLLQLLYVWYPGLKNFGLFFGLIFGLIFGLRERWQGINTDIRTVEGLRWSWQRFFGLLLIGGVIPGILTFTYTSMRFYQSSFTSTILRNGQTGAEIATLTDHTRDVSLDRFSPDGSRLVITVSSFSSLRSRTFFHLWLPPPWDSISFDTEMVQPDAARLWDGQTGEEIAVLTGHQDEARSVNFSPDNRYLITIGRRGAAQVWDAQTGEKIISLTDDTTRVVSSAGFRESIRGIDEPVRDTYLGHTRLVTINPDNNLAQVWDWQTDEEITRLNGHAGGLNLAKFSSDGTRLITTRSGDTWSQAIVQLWDGQTGREIATLGDETDELDSASFSPDGSRLVIVRFSLDITRGIVQRAVARLWDGQTGDEIATLARTKDFVQVDFSPDGTRLMGVIESSSEGTAWLWDGQTSDAIRTFAGSNSEWPVSAQFSPDSTRLLIVNKNDISQLWDAKTGEKIATLTGGGVASFSPDSTRLVTAIPARLWDGKTGKAIATLTTSTERLSSGTFSPDSTRLVTVSSDNIVKLWDAETGNEIATLAGHIDHVRWATFSPDGTRLVTTSGISDYRNLSPIWLLPGLLLGMFGALRHNIVDTRTIPNLGIRLTARNAVMAAFGVGLVIGLMVKLFSVETYWAIAVGWTVGWLTLIWYGGLDVLQHFTLRLILSMKGYASWRYVRFLDYAVERIFLRKVGGGYIFVHRLLLEHFMKLESIGAEDLQVPLKDDPALQKLIKCTITTGKKAQPEKGFKNVYNKFAAWIYFHRAFAAYRLINDRALKQAIIYSCQGIKRNPNSPVHWNNLCWFGCLCGCGANVIEAGEQAVKLAPNNGGFRDTRGLARALTGDYEGAIEDLKFVLEWQEQHKMLINLNVGMKQLTAGNVVMVSFGVGVIIVLMARFFSVETYWAVAVWVVGWLTLGWYRGLNVVKHFCATRQAWVIELEAGRNPINEVTLEELWRGGE